MPDAKSQTIIIQVPPCQGTPGTQSRRLIENIDYTYSQGTLKEVQHYPQGSNSFGLQHNRWPYPRIVGEPAALIVPGAVLFAGEVNFNPSYGYESYDWEATQSWQLEAQIYTLWENYYCNDRWQLSDVSTETITGSDENEYTKVTARGFGSPHTGFYTDGMEIVVELCVDYDFMNEVPNRPRGNAFARITVGSFAPDFAETVNESFQVAFSSFSFEFAAGSASAPEYQHNYANVYLRQAAWLNWVKESAAGAVYSAGQSWMSYDHYSTEPLDLPLLFDLRAGVRFNQGEGEQCDSVPMAITGMDDIYLKGTLVSQKIAATGAAAGAEFRLEMSLGYDFNAPEQSGRDSQQVYYKVTQLSMAGMGLTDYLIVENFHWQMPERTRIHERQYFASIAVSEALQLPETLTARYRTAWSDGEETLTGNLTVEMLPDSFQGLYHGIMTEHFPQDVDFGDPIDVPQTALFFADGGAVSQGKQFALVLWRESNNFMLQDIQLIEVFKRS